ncbi:hypothetical protein DXG01_015294 [Tephrocybe rancida]|nr:hypothetical protein DXG01_015294 [Tephrocybe rancida]
MVALSPRFAVLAAFISLASLSISPLSVGAVAIPKANEHSMADVLDRAQSAFHLAHAKAMKRDELDCDGDFPLCVKLYDEKILRRGQQSSHWAMKKKGKSYTVSPKHRHSSKKHPNPHNAHVGREEMQAETGTIDIISPSAKKDDGKTLGHLYVKKPDNQQKPEVQQMSATSESYPVEFSSTEFTPFTLVRGSGAATGDGETMKFVRIQASRPREAMAAGETGATELCMTYDTLKTSGLFMAPCVDETDKGKMKQIFGYDPTTQNVTPLQDTPKDPNGAAQGVLARDDEPKDVVLKFNPTHGDASAADVAEPSNAASPTSTMTKTVTVTKTPAASMSAADVTATPSANTSSSSVASLTSTSKGAAPTAGAVGTSGAPGTAGVAGVMDVQVVQPSSASSAMLSASSSASSALPTTTMNAQDVAASVAGSSTAAPTTATPAASAIVSTSASSVAAAPSSVSSSTPSSALNVRAVRTEPYKWVFRRE